MNSLKLIEKYYSNNPIGQEILINHSRSVADKALSIAKNHPKLELDIQFIEEAALLHDIGIFMTNAPKIHQYGELPYICHGYLGRELLEKEGYPLHALICERHTGTGISLQDIIKADLPVPHRDMIPQTIEEKLICFADCFFSKTKLGQEKSIEKVRSNLQKFGENSLKRFDEWCELFL